MGELISQIFSAFSTAISGLTSGLKNAFLNILYVDPEATTPVISDFAKYVFLMIGLSFAISIVFLIVKKLRA